MFSFTKGGNTRVKEVKRHVYERLGVDRWLLLYLGGLYTHTFTLISIILTWIHECDISLYLYFYLKKCKYISRINEIKSTN